MTEQQRVIFEKGRWGVVSRTYSDVNDWDTDLWGIGRVNPPLENILEEEVPEPDTEDPPPNEP